jgi:hypothetical protein
VRKPCLAHFSAKGIRFAVKKCGPAKKRTEFTPVGTLSRKKTASRSVDRALRPAGALGKAFNFIDFGESMSIVRHAL